MPTTVLALGQAVADDRCTVDRVLGILAQDPALSATLLRLANSVMYARDDRVMDLRSAVMRLGFDTVFNLGQSAAIIRSIRGGSHLDPLRLWQHSVAVGLVAKGICGLVGQDASTRSPPTWPACSTTSARSPWTSASPTSTARWWRPWPAGAVCLDAERGHPGRHPRRGGRHGGGAVELPGAPGRGHPRPPRGPADDFLTGPDPALRPPGPHPDPQLPRRRDPGLRAGGAAGLHDGRSPGLGADLDEERLTFGIDDELEHAITFVKLVFQE